MRFKFCNVQVLFIVLIIYTNHASTIKPANLLTIKTELYLTYITLNLLNVIKKSLISWFFKDFHILQHIKFTFIHFLKLFYNKRKVYPQGYLGSFTKN